MQFRKEFKKMLGFDVDSLYLAGPWFNDHENRIYNQVLSKLRKEGIEVYAPRENFIPGGKEMDNLTWSKLVFLEDLKHIDYYGAVLMLDFGFTSDAGTAWEAGYMAGMWAVDYEQGYPPVVHLMINDKTEGENLFSLMVYHGTDYHLKYTDVFGFEGATPIRLK